jgi:hypothetical protein
MSVDITSGNLSGTTNVPSFTASSFCAWVRLATSSPADYTLAGVDDAVTHYILMGRSGAGPTGFLSVGTDAGVVDLRTHAQLLNTWTWVAYSAGPVNTIGYYSLDGETIVNAGSVASSTGTPTGKYISTDGFGDGGWSGLIVGVKMFDSALSSDQLLLEAARLRPSATSNLWLPLLNNSNTGVDWSGTADMTPSGSFSSSRLMPSIPWKG